MPQPRLCWVCKAPATLLDQRRRPGAVLALRGGIKRRFDEWTGRYLCDAHADVDPWAGP
jgi:hypothetical protein